jgi:hypothetical protein
MSFKNFYLLIGGIFSAMAIVAQNNFDYSISISPLSINDLPGFHSYAHAQHDGKWLIVGGRKDGLHARQPFNSFPQAYNNKDFYVIDVKDGVFYNKNLTSLPGSIEEQLQSTNMNFYQDNDTLYIVGGYAYSESYDNHITFPYLTSIHVSGLINAIVNNEDDLTPYVKQTEDAVFAVTGGQLGKIGQYFYLIGGHRFDGRYNPHGPTHGPGFTQTYTNQIRKFKIDNSGNQLSYSDYSTITDPVHLRRRDYNLVPQILPDGSEGYIISSGVFQINDDLPFLYPVEISESGYTPVTGFNQYLSNYHSAKVGIYDSTNNEMHSIFFGGISQYYYSNGNLIQDNLVPFVKTISMITRYADGSFEEFQLPVEMPGLRGASAEFIPNKEISHYGNEVVKLNDINNDTVTLGYILGGIGSSSLNPFSNNRTSDTYADNTIYEVKLIKGAFTNIPAISGSNPYIFDIFPNPTKGKFTIRYHLPKPVSVTYFIPSIDGKILQKGLFNYGETGDIEQNIMLNKDIINQPLLVTLIFDKKFYQTKKLLKN